MYYISENYRGNARFESAGMFSDREPFLRPDRTLSCYELIFMLEGRLTVRIGDTERTVRAGDFMMIPPRTPHSSLPEEAVPLRFFRICFHSRELSPIREEEVSEHCLNQDPDRLMLLPDISSQLNMQNLFSMCFHIAHICRDSASRFYLNTATNFILSEISHETLNSLRLRAGRQGKLQPVRDWLRLHACEPLSLEQIAAEFRYNPSYLSRKYKEEMGISLIDQITEFRIEQAKRLLRGTSGTIQEIAYEVGYNDPRYFMRLFRRRQMVTPSEYRKSFSERHIS